MSSTRRALLIASPYGELEGPENDVQMMAGVLQRRRFQMNLCCGLEATRDGILSAWHNLNKETSRDDVVVIYYSGHGGAGIAQGTSNEDADQPWRLQFVVPMDYDENSEDFMGITEMELSQLLLETTRITPNVTIILDCCHAGQMVRDPHYGKKTTRKNLSSSHHRAVVRHIEKLRNEGKLKARTRLENPDAVRIAAAAPWESAYEYESSGKSVGSLTEALVRVMEEVNDDKVSWKTVMFRVQELVNISFPQQHPRAEGQYTGLLFSLDHLDSGALPVRSESGNTARILAGRVAGVREKNIYAVMPPGSEYVDAQLQIATATVMDVSGFDAVVSLHWENGATQLPAEGAIAFLAEEALYKWPVDIPENLVELRKQVNQSRFIRCRDEGETSWLLEFRREGDRLTLNNSRGVQVFKQRFYGKASAESYNAAVAVAKRVARAQHFLTQSCDPTERLQHDLEIQLGLVQGNRRGRIIHGTTGEDSISEGSDIFIYLRNHDLDARIFVSVFEVEANGQINAVSDNPDGIDLPPGRDHTLGTIDGRLEGLSVKWPIDISKAQSVVETLVFVVSSEPVNLQFLASPKLVARGDSSNWSSLESRFYSLAQGLGRRIESKTRKAQIRYDIVQQSFVLKPRDSQGTP